MTKDRKFFIITTVLTILSALMLNNLWASDFLVDTARNLIDTSSVNPSDFYHNSHLMDLASMLPFHSQYLIWDTSTIHPYHYDMGHMTDTVMLVLANHKDCAFVVPVAGFVTSNFGPRTKTRYHYGIDLELNIGDSVSAAFDGIVRISQYSQSYGNCVVIRHYNGLETLYGHLKERNVVVGQVVHAGDLLGYGGNTGRSTGPHLHFEVRYKGAAIDPDRLIDFENSEAHTLRNDTVEITQEMFSYLNRVKYTGHRKGQTARDHGKSRGVYVIHRGDTLSEVAIKNGTTINRLCQVNRISRGSRLRPGQKLKVR